MYITKRQKMKKRILTMLIPLTFVACTNNFNEVEHQDKKYNSQEQIKELNRNYNSELNKYNISELTLIIDDSINKNYQLEIINIIKNNEIYQKRTQEINIKINEFEKTKKIHLSNLSNKTLNNLIKEIEKSNNKNNYVTNTTYREFNNMIEMDKSLLIDNYIIDLTISKQ